MRLKSFDNYLIIAMSALALVCLYMLYGTKHMSSHSDREIKVASIVEQLKTVKRKRDYFQGWIDVKPGDSLSQNDEIYTHEQSSAHIKFTNGPEVSLFENSLLRIKSAEFGNTISLEKGNMIAKLGPKSPKLDVELNGKKYTFSSQNADIQIEQGKSENKFLLLSGKAKFADQEILSNQVAIMDIQTGALRIKEIPFNLKYPIHNQTQYYIKEAAINFSWVNSNQSIPAKLVIARDFNFSEIIFEENVESNQYLVTLSQAGTYYWKIDSSDLIDSPVRSFSLIEEIRPTISADQTLLQLGPQSNTKAYLNWSKNDGKKYLIKIENSDGMSEEVSTSKNYFEFNTKNLGIYSFSVKVADESRSLALWSDPLSISVIEARPISITPLTPELIEKVTYNGLASTYLLSWSGPLDGTQYIIKLTKDSKTIIMNTEQTSMPLSLKDLGAYDWEVVGTSSAGMTSNKITGKILIKKPLESSQDLNENAIVELDRPDQLVTFKWSKTEADLQYQFELSDEPSFKNIINIHKVNDNSISTSLSQVGNYYWRVKVKRGSNTEYSNPISVEIKPAPPLARPDVSPDIKIKLKYLEETSSSFNLIDLFISKAQAEGAVVVAEWDLQVNNKAKSYIVEIYKDSELKELITSIETDVAKVVWKNAISGTFYWRVSYVDFWGRKTEFSKVSVLSTEAQEIKPTIVEIKLQNPKHKAEILNEVTDHFQFNWEIIPEVKNYLVVIARDLEFQNIILQKNTSLNELKLSCDLFNKNTGEFYWKVTSGENTSKRRQFSILCSTPPEPILEKVEEPKAVLVVEEKPIVKEVKLNEHFLKLGFFPHHISYQNKAGQYTAKIDGNALNSWFATYQRRMDIWYFQTISPTLSISRGKVFKTLTFMDMDLNLQLKRKQDGFSWGPALAFMKKTLYVESNLAIKDQSLTSPLFGFFFQKEIDLITLNTEIKMGAILNFNADIQYRFKSNIEVGAFIDSTSITKDDNKHSFLRYGLNLNYVFDFLEIAN